MMHALVAIYTEWV